eukprot:jgi/Bigna1/62337/fgenesh1_kg.33_\
MDSSQAACELHSVWFELRESSDHTKTKRNQDRSVTRASVSTDSSRMKPLLD